MPHDASDRLIFRPIPLNFFEFRKINRQKIALQISVLAGTPPIQLREKNSAREHPCGCTAGIARFFETPPPIFEGRA
jgi:hypothetical protein